MTIPAIICANGIHPVDGLPQCVRALRHFSPDTPIFVAPFASYDQRARQFAQHYKNFSPNPVEFELTCFQRYFVLHEFCRRHNIDSCWGVEWDVLVVCDLQTEAEYMATNSIGLAPNFYCSHLEQLGGALDYVERVYRGTTLPGEKTLAQFVEDYAQNRIYHLGDNHILNEFWKEAGIHLPTPHKDHTGQWSAFDNNLCNAGEGFVMEGDGKQLNFIKGKVYAQNSTIGQLVQMKTLHCSGPHKSRMSHYLDRILLSRR